MSIHLPPASLSIPATRLFGRADQLAAARGLLDGGARLVTLTGPGGAGKTRLALEIASRLAGSGSRRAITVQLQGITEASLLSTSIARAVGLQEQPRESLDDSLEAWLEQQPTLLVLDNVEQIAGIGGPIEGLLAHCPSLLLLVTSRRALHLAVEHELSVPPLAVPDPRVRQSPEALVEYPAAALFLDRARASRPDFQLRPEDAPVVADICARLDGLPLALELAAGRLARLSPRELLDRLPAVASLGGLRATLPDADLDAVQRRLRQTIAWSYALLDDAQRRALRRLAPFVGGAAESAVLELLGPGAVATLAALEDNHLLRRQELPDGPRYLMLNMIRAFALDRLVATDEEVTAFRAHADVFLTLAERVAPRLWDQGQTAALNELNREHENVVAALRWCCRDGDAERGLRLGNALWRFWYVRGHFAIGRQWLEQVLALPTAATPTERRSAVLNGAGNLAFNQGDFAGAEIFHTEALQIRRASGDRRGVAGSVNNLALLAAARGERAEAHQLFREAIAINRELGNHSWEAINLSNLSNVLRDEGQLDQARQLQEESLELFSSLGDDWGAGLALGELGRIAFFQDDRLSARAYLDGSLALRRKVGDRRGIATVVVTLGHLMLANGNRSTARSHFIEGLALFRELGDRRGLVDGLEGFALLAAAGDQAERAVRLAGAAAALRAALNAPAPALWQARTSQLLAPSFATLGESVATETWAAGEALSVEQAVEEALLLARG